MERYHKYFPIESDGDLNIKMTFRLAELAAKHDMLVDQIADYIRQTGGK